MGHVKDTEIVGPALRYGQISMVEYGVLHSATVCERARHGLRRNTERWRVPDRNQEVSGGRRDDRRDHTHLEEPARFSQKGRDTAGHELLGANSRMHD